MVQGPASLVKLNMPPNQVLDKIESHRRLELSTIDPQTTRQVARRPQHVGLPDQR